MKINLQTFKYSPQNKVVNKNFKPLETLPKINLKNRLSQDTVSFQGLSEKDKRSIDLMLATAVLLSAAGAGLSVYSAFNQPEEEVAPIEEQGEIQTPEIPDDIIIDTRSDEEKFEEAKEALIQAVHDYEVYATNKQLYGIGRMLEAIEEMDGSEGRPDYSDFVQEYQNLITFNKDIFPGVDPSIGYEIGDTIKDTEKTLDLIRDTIFSALYTYFENGGYDLSSITALNDVSRSERQSILNLLNGILNSKEASDETKQAAQIYKEEIIKAEGKYWARPFGFYDNDALESEIDSNEALKTYLIANVDSIKENAEELEALKEAYRATLSYKDESLEQKYLEACEQKDSEAQDAIRRTQYEDHIEHYGNTVLPAYQAYYEAYNSKIVFPLEEIWPDLKFADVSIELFDMVEAVANAEERLRDEMGITSGFDTTGETVAE